MALRFFLVGSHPGFIFFPFVKKKLFKTLRSLCHLYIMKEKPSVSQGSLLLISFYIKNIPRYWGGGGLTLGVGMAGLEGGRVNWETYVKL